MGHWSPSDSFTRVSGVLLHCVDACVCQIQHGMVGGSFGSGAECLTSDLGFATSAVGKSGNLSEPQFPHLQSGNGANISYEGLRSGANATTKRMLLAQEGAQTGSGPASHCPSREAPEARSCDRHTQGVTAPSCMSASSAQSACMGKTAPPCVSAFWQLKLGRAGTGCDQRHCSCHPGSNDRCGS